MCTYPDLSQADNGSWTTWLNSVRSYLDDDTNDSINVVMWSWCNIAGHNVNSYISSMQTLINEYGANGTKIGTGAGRTKTVAVTFIFMTGHANTGSNTGAGNPKALAETIVNYCRENGYFCLDYYSIDTHDMNDNYWEDAGDDGNSAAYDAANGAAGNQFFYAEWQTSHTEGTHWYANKTSPGGAVVSYGEHNNQHITANRKAYAMWWILARIAGW